MQYIEAVSKEKAWHNLKLFLAGGITGCHDWQTDLAKEIESQKIQITVYNPRRKDFPIGDPGAAEEQIAWEHYKLRESSAISFWFPKETMCPIVLWELAAALERDVGRSSPPRIIIGMDREYKRRQDVEIQTSLMNSEIEIHTGFDSFKSSLVRMLKRMASNPAFSQPQVLTRQDLYSKILKEGDSVAGRRAERSPVLCVHANEAPAVCTCPENCYCKQNTCRTG